MKKYIVLSLCLVCLSVLTQVKAQSEVFAGGEIYVEYVGDGSEACDDDLPYDITYKFYRDPGGPAFPFPADRTVVLRDETDPNQANWTTMNILLDDIDNRGSLDPICLFISPVATEGRWYKNSTPVMLSSNRKYRVMYGPGEFRSPENNNIQAGQRFYVETLVSAKCDTLTTTLLDTPPEERLYYNNGFNTAPQWAIEDIVESFCHGQYYEYALPVYDNDLTVLEFTDPDGNLIRTEEVRDQITFDLVSAKVSDGGPVNYESGFSSTAPFPSSTPIQLENGILKFTPDLPLGQNSFTADINILVTESRKTYKLVPDGFGNMQRISEDLVLTRTFREMRLVFGRNCNPRLPDFEIENRTFNAGQGGWELNCGETEIEVRMTEPMLCVSFQSKDPSVNPIDLTGLIRVADAELFTIHRGVVPNLPLEDGNPFDPTRVEILNCNQEGTFTRFKIYLNRPIGPGNYVMFASLSDDPDGNTMVSRCGFELPELEPIPLYVNTNSEYTYMGTPKDLEFCFPSDTVEPGMVVNALEGQTLLQSNAVLFTYGWRGNRFATEQFKDSVLGDATDPTSANYRIDQSFTVPQDWPVTPIPDKTDRYWTFGVGLDFSYMYQGDTITTDMYCYDEDDNVFVQIFEHPPFNFPDIDLCIGEEWPLVAPDIDYTNSTAILENVNWYVKDPDPDYRNLNPDPVLSNPPDSSFRPVGGQSNSNTINDTLDIASIAYGVGKRFTVGVVVEFDICPVPAEFVVVQEEVNVYIGPDSTICPGGQYTLENFLDSSYLVPDSMYYQWYFNDQPITGADSLTVLVEDEGEYKLIVTKNTPTGSCFGADSMYLEIADSLVITEPICSQVTYKDGQVEQRFYWPVVPGADNYEVRGLDASDNPITDWELPNDLYGLHHRINGEQVRLQVRAVNYEVDSLSPCRFGESAIAEACEIIVKPVNIFTPNGDGINDFLKFDLIELFPGSSLQIFNRWGKLIYESGNYRNDWDGDDHKDGTYFYVLDVNDPQGIQDIFKGNFTIVR